MKRLAVQVAGIVQGVGFRPFVYHLARQHNLAGWVRNDGDGVAMEIEGETKAVAAFCAAVADAPPPAAVSSVSYKDCLPTGETGFSIRESGAALPAALVVPDLATCAACRKELFNPGDRRYRYPFINCTCCGPRYSIIRALPYDRTATTMTSFPMCDRCSSEYAAPSDRRFHAQPNACPDCGPVYRLLDRSGRAVTGLADVFQQTRQLIVSGHIVAIKGIGGYHLACDARSQAVSTLRSRKIRQAKPFAVMCGSLAAVRRLCLVTPEEEKLLSGKERPVVLLAKSEGCDLAPDVAPQNRWLGVMLPYAPVHWLLLCPDDVWVMTSGNLADEPILYEDETALMQLRNIADYFLVHNRMIYRQTDDSVVRLFNNRPYFVRRSRGFAPAPVRLSAASGKVLAVGGDLKNTFCLTCGNLAFVSAHMGDLGALSAFECYRHSVTAYSSLFQIMPELVAHDLHAGYVSTQYALSLGLPATGVQHHHAHIASVMAEHGLAGPVIGVAFDGTGYGPDGRLWGGEFLIADLANFTRAAHCTYLPLPGGAQAIQEPWRLAAWVLHQLWGNQLTHLSIPFVRTLPPEWRTVVSLPEHGLAPWTSSAGRLFDIAAAILGLRNVIDYEGQAAAELELLAGKGLPSSLPYAVYEKEQLEIDFMPAFAALTEQLRQNRPVQELAAAFHATVAAMISDVVIRLQRQTGIKQVALSGGVFQNMLLLGGIVRLLDQYGLTVYWQRQVPPNDGGLSLGQAAVAAERWRRR